MAGADETREFPLAEARKLVRDLMTPNPRIYWLDYLVYATLGWGAFGAAVVLPAWSPGQVACTVIAALALYRAVIFTHELAHLKKGTFGLFRLVWNLTAGFPMMVPSFTYHGVHNDHHRRDVYGTREDGEYVPFGATAPTGIIAYLLLIFVLPLFFPFRFVILTPLSYFHKRLRRWVWRRASSLTIDLSYARPDPARSDDPSWPAQEIATFVYGAGILALIALGVLPPGLLAVWYVVVALVFLLNSLRTLAAHAYRNPGDRAMSLSEQVLDSVDVPGNLLITAMWAPVGLRYHATHHLFPNLPYHSLGKAHRRLVAELTDNRLYLAIRRDSLWHALKRLWSDARASQSS